MISRNQQFVVRSCFFTLTVGFIVSLAAIQDVRAMTITPNTTWPGSPNFQTGVPAQVGNRDGVGSGRLYIGQTFDVTSAFTVTDVYVILNPLGTNNNVDYRFTIYPTTQDTNTGGAAPASPPPGGSPPSVGANLWTSPTWNSNTALPTATADQVVRFALAPAEQFTLTPVAGVNGYTFQVEYQATAAAATAFQLAYSPGGNIYSGGRWWEPGDSNTNADVILAFVGTAVADVPEPSTYALSLIGLAGLGLAAWRKHRARG